MGFLDAWMYCFLDSWVQDCLSGFASVSLSNLQLPCVPLAAYRFFHQVLSGPLDHCPSLCQVYFPRQNKYILDLEALKAYILCQIFQKICRCFWSTAWLLALMYIPRCLLHCTHLSNYFFNLLWGPSVAPTHGFSIYLFFFCSSGVHQGVAFSIGPLVLLRLFR